MVGDQDLGRCPPADSPSFLRVGFCAVVACHGFRAAADQTSPEFVTAVTGAAGSQRAKSARECPLRGVVS